MFALTHRLLHTNTFCSVVTLFHTDNYYCHTTCLHTAFVAWWKKPEERGSVGRVGRPITRGVGGSIPTQRLVARQRCLERTPMLPGLPGRCDWSALWLEPTAPVYDICLYTLCMCVFNRWQPGWVKSENFMYFPVHDNTYDLNLLFLNGEKQNCFHLTLKCTNWFCSFEMQLSHL